MDDDDDDDDDACKEKIMMTNAHQTVKGRLVDG